MRTTWAVLLVGVLGARHAGAAPYATLDAFGAVGFDPDVASSGTGTAIVVWRSAALDGPYDVVFSRSASGGGWTSPTAVAPPAPPASQRVEPAIAAAPEGTWMATWKEECASGLPGPVAVARSADDGVTWSGPVLVSAGSCTASPGPFDGSRPAVASDGGGRWLVAWQGILAPGGDQQVFAVRSGDDGRAWTAPAPIDPAPPDEVGVADRYVDVQADGAGTWLAAWLRSTAGGADVRIARSVDGGATWGASVAFDTASLVDAAPALATDGVGRWGAVWRAGDDTLAWVSSADGGLSWSAPRPVVSGGGRISDLRAPGLVVDATGRWTIAWATTDGLGGALGSDLDVLYLRSSDGGATWSEPRPLDPDAVRDDGRSDVTPALAAAGSAVLAVWDSFTTNLDGFPATDVHVARVQ